MWKQGSREGTNYGAVHDAQLFVCVHFGCMHAAVDKQPMKEVKGSRLVGSATCIKGWPDTHIWPRAPSCSQILCIEVRPLLSFMLWSFMHSVCECTGRERERERERERVLIYVHNRVCTCILIFVMTGVCVPHMCTHTHKTPKHYRAVTS